MLWSKCEVFDGAHMELRVSLSVSVLDLEWNRGWFFFFPVNSIHACQCLLRCLQAFGSFVNRTGGILAHQFTLLCF